MEREIKGQIEKYSELTCGFQKDNETPWTRIGLKVNGEWHTIFSPNGKPTALEQLQEAFPVGSFVKFREYKKQEADEYWNYKKESLTLCGNGVEKPVNKDLGETQKEPEVEEIDMTNLEEPKKEVPSLAPTPKTQKSFQESKTRDIHLQVCLKIAGWMYAASCKKSETIFPKVVADYARELLKEMGWD